MRNYRCVFVAIQESSFSTLCTCWKSGPWQSTTLKQQTTLNENSNTYQCVPTTTCFLRFCRGFFPPEEFPGFKKLQPNQAADKVPKHCAPCVRLLTAVKDTSWGTESKVRTLFTGEYCRTVHCSRKTCVQGHGAAEDSV